MYIVERRDIDSEDPVDILCRSGKFVSLSSYYSCYDECIPEPMVFKTEEDAKKHLWPEGREYGIFITVERYDRYF